MTQKQTYIWALPIRLFHWLLAISFVAAFVLGEEDEFRKYHIAFGAVVGVLIVFRILYGLTGSRYSGFKDFPIGISLQVTFVRNMFNPANVYAGHNPLASMAMLSIFATGIVSSVTGYLCYSTHNELYKEIHEVFAKIFLGFVVLHIIGIIMDKVTHGKVGTLQSIFTGYKNIDAEDTKTNTFQKIFSIFWFLAPVIVFFYVMSLNIVAEKKEKEHDKEKTEHHEKKGEKDDDD